MGEQLGLAVWTTDQAGPFQTLPYPGHSWECQGHPQRQPHEYIRNGTAKLLTLFHPANGELRTQGVTSCTNVVLHGWLKQELSAILATLPEPVTPPTPEAIKALWAIWTAGLTRYPTVPAEPAAPRMLLVLDNLQGHLTPTFVIWLCDHGIIPLYTPLGGSWLNMAESIQRIIERRALEGQHPESPAEIIDWLEAATRAGIASRRPLSGAANAPPAGSAVASGVMRLAVPALVPAARFDAARACSIDGYKHAK